jgi:hypothetical protein
MEIFFVVDISPTQAELEALKGKQSKGSKRVKTEKPNVKVEYQAPPRNGIRKLDDVIDLT